MTMEILGADAAEKQVNVVVNGDNGFASEKEAGIESEKQVPLVSANATDATKETDNKMSSSLPKDAMEEWPAPKQLRAFYFPRFRPYDDPKMKDKLEKAEKDRQKKIQAQNQIIEVLRAKRLEKSSIIEQLKPFNEEIMQYNGVIESKRQKIKPLRTELGKIRNDSSTGKDKDGTANLCSSEEELDAIIKSLNYRISHESISLNEEKKLMKEIRALEGSRKRVIENVRKIADMQGTVVKKESIQDQVKLIGADIDEVKRDRDVISMKMKPLEEQLNRIKAEIAELEGEREVAVQKVDQAFQTARDLRNSRDSSNECFFTNRTLLKQARDLGAAHNVAFMEELIQKESEAFFTQWNSNKSFRVDYEKRVRTSFDARQLSEDGRMRNPGEKSIAQEDKVVPVPEVEASVVKVAPKETVVPVPPVQSSAGSKKAEEETKHKTIVEKDDDRDFHVENPLKEKEKHREIDEEKLKEMRREEAINKNKLALERKKKLAEKSAAKLAAKTQLEAEKKQKEKEKKAKKKAAAVAPSLDEEEQTDAADETTEEAGEAEQQPEDIPAPTKSKTQKDIIKPRQKSTRKLPVMPRRKKSATYWSWAIPAAVAAALVALIAIVVFYYNQHVPASY